MNDLTLPELIAELCTPPEQQAIHLAFHPQPHHPNGLGINRTASHLQISSQAVRSRLDAARRKLNRAGAHAANPLELHRFADWIRERNRRDILPDTEPNTQPDTHQPPSAAAQLDGMRRSGDIGPAGVPITGYGPGAIRIDIGRHTVSSRPDIAITRLIA